MQVSTDAQAVELVTGELQGALFPWQVLHFYSIGKFEETASDIAWIVMLIRNFLTQDMPNGDQELPGNGQNRPAAP